MSKITFSTKEIKTLQKNPNIQRVSERAITYTDAFLNSLLMSIWQGNSQGKSLRRMALTSIS